MKQPPETIYLIPGEDVDGAPCMVWCDDPAPSYACDPAEAVGYVRKDRHQSELTAEKAENEALRVRVVELEEFVSDTATACQRSLDPDWVPDWVQESLYPIYERCHELLGDDPDEYESPFRRIKP